MFTVAFAFVVATALMFVFKQTRWMGVVAAFVLLAINPLFFTGLLLVAGVGYYLFTKKKTSRVTAKPLLGPNDQRGFASRDVIILLGALGLGGALVFASLDSPPDISPSTLFGRLRSTPSEEVIVLRTPGGRLEVSRLYATEVIDARVTHKVLGIEVGELIPRIRVPCVFTYHVELAKEWRVLRTDGVFTVIVPTIKPSLPVAIDLSGIERDVSGTWILQPWKGRKDLANLERSVTEKLAQKAASRDYLDRQRDEARETVREFARKWIVEQTPWRWLRRDDIRVLFEDEHVGALEWLSG